MSFFATLRRVRKGKQTTEYQLKDVSTRADKLLTGGGSGPGLTGQSSLGGRTENGLLESPANSNYSNSDYEDALSIAESLETCSISSDTVSPLGHRGRNNTFRQRKVNLGKPTHFVAHTSELLTTSGPKKTKNGRPRGLGSTPALNYGVEDCGGSPFSVRRCGSDGFQDDRSISSSTLSLCHHKSDEERKREAAMITGVKKFNWNPRKGAEFLQNMCLVGPGPTDVAEFLRTCETLSKNAIGTYLGEPDEYCQEVLHAFVNLQELAGKSLVEAMRVFLASFRLPGEAQKIDRIMEAFAEAYCSQNPDVFSTTDACYLLSYAVIMLNTTLHNPNVKDKPSAERFLQMNRGIDFGDSVDQEFLLDIYQAIKSEEFQVPKDEGRSAADLKLAFYYADRKGWLWKRGEGKKSWKRRWFVLSDNCLYYFKLPTDKNPRTIIPLENIEAVPGPRHPKYALLLLRKSSDSPKSSPNTEYIKSCKRLHDGTMVLGRHSEFILGATDPEERDEWVAAIQQNSSSDSYYRIVQEKKQRILALQNKKKTSRKKTVTGRKGQIRKSQIGSPKLIEPEENHQFFGHHLDIPEGDQTDDEEEEGDEDAYSSSRESTEIRENPPPAGSLDNRNEALDENCSDDIETMSVPSDIIDGATDKPLQCDAAVTESSDKLEENSNSGGIIPVINIIRDNANDVPRNNDSTV